MSYEGSDKEPFVPQEARQQPEITPDTPLSELRVRDLATLMGGPAQASGIKKLESGEVFKVKAEHEKILKGEKVMLTKWEHHKWEQYKWEHYKVEHYKVEVGEFVVDQVFLDPGPLATVNPAAGGINELIKRVTELSEKVDRLSDQTQKGGGG